MSRWKVRIVNLTLEPPEDLLAHPFNARAHGGKQREAMRGLLDEIGWVTAVIQNDITGYIIDGHQRIEEAITNGEPEIPVLHVELTEDEEAAVLASFDAVTTMAFYDEDRMTALMDRVRARDPRLDDLMTRIRSRAPTVPTRPLHTPDDEPDPPDGDVFPTPEFRTLNLVWTKAEYDEALALLAAVPGSSPAQKILNVLRRTR